MNRFFPINSNYTLKSSLIHDVKNKFFMYEIIKAKDNFNIKIEYKTVDNLFILHHTEVPIRHRGQNFGFFIAKEVFDYLIEHNIKTALYCPFLKYYKKEYPNVKLNNIIEKLPIIDKSLFEYLEEPW